MPTTFALRRHLAVVGALVAPLCLPLAACSNDADTPASSSEPTTLASTSGDTRTVQTEMGEVRVPVEPRRVVALDEYAAMNALTFGIEPVEVWGSYQSEIAAKVLADAGIEVTPGTVEGGVNFEAVTEANPDLIILTPEAALMSAYDKLSQIAPVLLLPYSEPWRDVVTTSAEAFGMEDRGAAIIAALEGRIDEVAALVGDGGPIMSILGDTMGMLFAMAPTAPLSQLVAEAGYTRPTAQAEGKVDPTYDAAVMISEEVLGDHDGDVIVLLEGTYYRSATFRESPTFTNLPGVRAGKDVVVDGDMWAGSYPFAISWILDDLEAIATGTTDDIGTTDDLDARWADYTELVG